MAEQQTTTMTGDWRRAIPEAEALRYRSLGWWRETTGLDEFLRVAESQPHKHLVQTMRLNRLILD